LRNYVKLAGSVITTFNDVSLSNFDWPIVGVDDDELESRRVALLQFLGTHYHQTANVKVNLYWKLDEQNLSDLLWKLMNPQNPQGPALYVFGKGGDRLTMFTDESPRKSWSHGR
jgi:hypothetical protein